MKATLTAAFGTGLLLLLLVGMGQVAFLQILNAPELAIPPRSIALSSDELNDTGEESVVSGQSKDFSEITKRPLFHPTRRPAKLQKEIAGTPEVTSPPVETGQSIIARPTVHLHGVIGKNGGFAALISIEGGAPTWFQERGEIQQWMLSEIGPDWIDLTLRDRKFRVELYEQ